MKTSSTIHALLFASVATVSLATSPLLCAQMATPDPDQGTKAPDSTADKNSATTGSSTTTTPGADKTTSKDTTTSLDKNPSAVNTGSAEKSATKDPTGTTDLGTSTTSNKSTKMSDKEFLLTAAQGGMTEVQLGKLAQEKGSSADVKQFGSHMDMDHSKANAELKTVATKEGVTIPTTLDAKHQAMVDRMSKLSGAAFDRAYVHAMVKDHEKTAAEFRKASTSAQDPDVKNFAASTLPTIENHLSDIKSIQSKLP